MLFDVKFDRKGHKAVISFGIIWSFSSFSTETQSIPHPNDQKSLGKSLDECNCWKTGASWVVSWSFIHRMDWQINEIKLKK